MVEVPVTPDDGLDASDINSLLVQDVADVLLDIEFVSSVLEVVYQKWAKVSPVLPDAEVKDEIAVESRMLD